MEDDLVDLNWQVLPLKPEPQIVIAHKQLNENEHFVFTHGEQPGPFRCFKLTRVKDTLFHPEEMRQTKEVIQVAKEIGLID